jgi:hypothetical protein
MKPLPKPEYSKKEPIKKIDPPTSKSFKLGANDETGQPLDSYNKLTAIGSPSQAQKKVDPAVPTKQAGT